MCARACCSPVYRLGRRLASTSAPSRKKPSLSFSLILPHNLHPPTPCLFLRPPSFPYRCCRAIWTRCNYRSLASGTIAFRRRSRLLPSARTFLAPLKKGPFFLLHVLHTSSTPKTHPHTSSPTALSRPAYLPIAPLTQGKKNK